MRVRVLSDSDPAYAAKRYDELIRSGFTEKEVGLIEKAGGTDLVVVKRLSGKDIARTEVGDGRFVVRVLPQELRNNEALVHVLQCIDPERPEKEMRSSRNPQRTKTWRR